MEFLISFPIKSFLKNRFNKIKNNEFFYEQERFSNFISSNNYFPFAIFTFYSINIKETHLTQQ